LKSKPTSNIFHFHCALFAAIFALMSFAVQGQQTDFGVWTSISLDKKLNNKFSINLAEELRFFQNAQRYDLSYTNLGISYKINKAVKFSLFYRNLQKHRDNNSISWRHRLYADLQIKQKFYPLTFVYRSRFQSQVRDYYSSDDGNIPERNWRHKFDLRYELLRGVTPYIAAEFRYQLKNMRNRSANNTINRGRYIIGCQYAYSRAKTFDLFFMHQGEMNVSNPQKSYNIGVEYNYSF